MTLVTRFVAPMATCTSVSSMSLFTAVPLASPSPSRRHPNTAAMLARIVIATLALAGAAHAQDQQLKPIPCVLGQPDCPLGEEEPYEGLGGMPMGAPQWGPYTTDWHDHEFQGNEGDTLSLQNARVADCSQDGDSKFPASGNPVALGSGNKFEPELDFSIGGEMGFALERSYNHFWNNVGLFGKHWLSSLDYSLAFDLPNGDIYAQRPDGRRIHFVGLGEVNQQEIWLELKSAPVARIIKNPDTSYTHYTEEGTIEIYRPDGRPKRIENRQGVGYTFTYSNGYVSSVTHDSGRAIGLTWTDGKLTQVTDPAGKVYLYGYDTNAFGNGVHRLKSVTLPGAPATTVTYYYEEPGAPGALTGKSFNGVRYSTFDYNIDKKVISSHHAGGVEHYTYDYVGHPNAAPAPDAIDVPPPPAPGAQCDADTGTCIPPAGLGDPNDPELLDRAAVAAQEDAALRELAGSLFTQVDETNPLGRKTFYQFEDYRLTKVEGDAATHCAASYRERTYDARGYEDVVEDFNGNITDFDYNNEGQLQKRIEGVGTPDARTTLYEWDVPNNRITRMTVLGDREETYAYWPDHRLKSVAVKNMSANGVANETHTTTYAYTKHGNGLLATTTVDGPLAGTGDAVVTLYSTQGDIVAVKNSLNHTLAYENYNARGQPGRMIGANGERTDYDYDDRGRIRLVRTFRNGGQQDTTYAYNGPGLLEKIVTPDGVTESYVYDDARRLKEINRNEPGGAARRVLTYNNASQVIREEVYRGNTLRYRAYTDYDELGRVRKRRGNHGQDVTFAYDTNNNLKTITDSLGKVTTFAHDALNRTKTQTDARNGVTAYAYDPGNRVRRVTDPRNLVTTYAYDGFGQLRTLTSPDTGTTTHAWDATGRLMSSQRADNVTVSFGYDPLGRRTSMSANGQSRTFQWDTCTNGKGRVCFLGGPGYGENRSYTPYGEIGSRQISHTGYGTAFDHGFAYDTLGRLIRITYPNGVEANYGYTLDRATSLTVKIGNQTRTVATVSAHEPMGPNRQLAFGNGGGRINHYDTDGRLSDIETDLKVGYHFEFDANDRITGFTNFANGFWSQEFGYDELHRLKSSASAGLGNHAYSYDANGNRKTHGATSYTIANGSNRLMGAGGRTFTYTLTGNVKTITGFSGVGETIFRNGFQIGQTPVTTYSYDPFDRLTGVTAPDLSASYEIGPDGTRFKKTVNGQITDFTYGPKGNLLTERQRNPGRWTNYLWFGGDPIAIVRDTALYWIQNDHLGRPEGITDQNRQRVWRANLKAFDRTVITDVIGGFHLGFPGQYHDPETGHAYNINRNYMPDLGRYLESDPIGLVGGMNTYAYVGSNSVNLVDPLGLEANVASDCANNVTIEIPITYTGPGAHASVISNWNNAIQSNWSGQFGKYSVTTTVVNGNTNRISVPAGDGRAYVVGGNRGVWPALRPGFTAAHEAGHLMGLRDRYNLATGTPLAGYSTNIMGVRGGAPSERDIADIISANSGGCTCR
jgi:RHS repeat-associated protein